ncbi:MAG: hypothetical protein U9P70_04370 [Patescibacteria group bacterium]|nr:hypothetical protein [Patescibacteria group bacterium]
MVKIFKNNLFWSSFLFVVIVALSVLSKWIEFLDLGVFNYSLLLIFFILLPNIKIIYREIKNSEIEKIKLPFCELKLLKKYDYYFIGYRKENELDGDLVVLGFYNNILNKEDALAFFKSDFPNDKSYIITEIIKQVHYKKNDE